jgi:hypothetical protein
MIDSTVSIELMKAFAVVLLALGVSAPAFAGPYVSTKSEFKGDEDGYSKTVNQARIGNTFDLGLGKSYVEAGGGITSPDSGDSEGFKVAEVGTKFKLTDSLSAKAKFEHKWSPDDERDWKFEVATKYKF